MSVDVRFGADNRPFMQGVDQMQARVSKMGTGMASALKGGIIGLAAGVVGGLGVDSLMTSIKDMGRVADLAKQLNDTAEGIQRVGAVATLNGANIEQVGRIFVAATSRVRDFQAGLTKIGEEADSPKKVARALKDLNIEANAFAKGTMTEQILMVAKGMGSMGSQTQANAAALDLLGNKGKEVLPMLQEGYAKLQAEMENTAIMTNEQVAQMDALGDQLDKLGQQTKVIAGNTALIGSGVLETLYSQAVKYAGSISFLAGSVWGLVGSENNAAMRGAEGLFAKAKVLEADAMAKLDPMAFTPLETGLATDTTEPFKASFEIRKKLEEEIAAYRDKKAMESLALEERLGILKKSLAISQGTPDTVADQEQEILITKQIIDLEAEAARNKQEAIQSIEEMEKKVAFDRLSTEEQIAQLRADSIAQADEGNYKAAAESAKAVSKVIADSTKKMMQDSAGFVVDSQRAMGGIGRQSIGISDGLPQKSLDEAQKQTAILTEIRTAIQEQDPSGLGTFK